MLNGALLLCVKDEQPPTDGYLKAKLTIGYAKGASGRYSHSGYVQTLGLGSLTPYGGAKKNVGHRIQ